MKPRAPQIVETFWNYEIGMQNYIKYFASCTIHHVTSPAHPIQNELIEIAAFQVQNEILKRIIENGFYTVLVDEARSFK